LGQQHTLPIIQRDNTLTYPHRQAHDVGVFHHLAHATAIELAGRMLERICLVPRLPVVHKALSRDHLTQPANGVLCGVFHPLIFQYR
jgi:hypothetical protein